MSTVFVCTRKGLFVFEQLEHGLKAHSQHFLGDPVTSACVDASGCWYAALNLGHFGPKMHKSEDRGASWREVGCPALPEKPMDSSDSSEWQIKQVWILEPVPESPGYLLAGTNPGALFVSRDGAQSWQLSESLWYSPQREKWFGGGFDDSGLHSIAINPDDHQHWTIAVSVGGVWHTYDAGDTWILKCTGMNAAYMPDDMADSEELQDPHRLISAPSNFKRMWVQHHCGIFVSDDAGKHWRECLHEQKSSFGFAVAVHPTQMDTAWFIPAIKDESRYPENGQLKVLKTIDGGQSFQALTRGLPPEACYDLVYRHALTVDDQGHSLTFGSTTGNLWHSMDGGAKWQTVSNHLPPIYAVRWFAQNLN